MTRTALVCTSVGSVAILAAALVIAGPLSPPGGPVAPTHKTLTDVEPRTAINATNTPGDFDSLFRITQPGSYYLTANIQGVSGRSAIEVAAPNVNIDLGGFRLEGVPGSLSGLRVGVANPHLVLRNGHIANWTGPGVDASLAPESSFADLTLSANGAEGLYVGAGARIERVTARANAGIGIRAHADSIFSACASRSNASHGFSLMGDGPGSSQEGGAVFTDCLAASNTGNGFNVYSKATLSRCTAERNLGNGVSVSAWSTISECTASDNTGHGFANTAASPGITFAGGGLSFLRCTATSNDLDGFATGSYAHVESCHAYSNTGDGIDAGTASRILANTCQFNGIGAPDAAGIRVTSSAVVEHNFLYANDRGLVASGSSNLVESNRAHANFVANFDLAANNIVAPVVAAPATPGAVLGNSGGSGLGSTNPHANFAY